MFGLSSKIHRKYFERMIEVRERLKVPYTEAPGFEGSDQALFLAQVTVYKAILELDTPSWAVKGDKQFRKYFKKTNQKLPDYDFYLLKNIENTNVETKIININDAIRLDTLMQ